MIPAALGSSIVRPYYNRGATGPPPIVRTPLGIIGIPFGPSINTVTIAGVTVAVGETLIAAICYDFLAGEAVTADVGGAGLTVAQLSLNFGSPTLRMTLFYVTADQAPYSGSLVFDFTSGSAQPTSAAALASKVAGLKTTAPLDKSKTASGTASGTQDSGLTAATVQASEYINGFIGTQGISGDTIGTWQAGMAAGQHIEANGVGLGPCIKEGWQVVSAIGTYRAEVLGAIPRRWGARCDTFKGV